MLDDIYSTLVEKLRKYCAYQERCHDEVLHKAIELDVPKHRIQEAICLLIEEGFLNEQRFANAIVRGKMNIKKWGPEKIKSILVQKKISPTIIKEALCQYDDTSMNEHIEYWFSKKWKDLKGNSLYEKKKKLFGFLLQKGFSSDLIQNFLQNKLKD